jgi:O-acetyl-ADP-ribose deacetylase (regulator of RNase III)
VFELTRGNLLNADAEALVNTVNCVGVMGKGVALQFKQAFPQNFQAYEQAYKRGKLRTGQMLVVPTMAVGNPKYIINFPTKVHWKGKSRLEYIDTGLEALVEEIQHLGIQSIAVPPLGCGNGGLDWRDVEPRIRAAFQRIPTVRALVFEPDGAPATDEMAIRTARPGLTRARALLILLLTRYREIGYRSSLLEVQKLAYFLQAGGEPMKLAYVKHKYGPYAENLNFVLQRLEGHYLRGYGDRSQRAEIRLVPGATDEAHAFLESFEDARGQLVRVERLIEGFESPYGMELLATIHWVVNEHPLIADDEAAVVKYVRAWSARKGELFTPRHIRLAWERLRDQGWFPEPMRGISRVG